MLTQRQRDVAAKLRRWRRNPPQFAHEVFGINLTEQQVEGLWAVKKNPRTSIRSGHGTGKDTNAAITIWWYLVTRKCRGLATAPTYRQLNDVLWGELTKWYMQSPLSDDFVVGKERIYHKQFPNDWWFRAAAINVKASAEQQAETLAGYHYDSFLIVVDEASGVPNPVFKPLEGIMTQKDNKILLIGNMTRSSGFFYETHFKDPQNLWYKLQWNSEDSSNVSKELIQYYRLKYGVDSDVYRIRVLGEPPRAEGESLVPLAMSQACVDLDYVPGPYDPRIFSLDVARYGDDRSVLTISHGPVILPQKYLYKMDTIAVAEWASRYIDRYDPEKVYVDALNMGAGVYDFLARKWGRARIIEVMAQGAAYDRIRYYNKRSEMYMGVREKCEQLKWKLPQDNDLFDELASIRYIEDEKSGIVRIASKRSIKKDPRLSGISPDKADSLSLQCYEPVGATLMKRYRGRTYKRQNEDRHRVGDWRAV